MIMAESKKPPQPEPVPPALASGSGATDPTVQRLLAQRTALAQWDTAQLAVIESARSEIEARKAEHAAIDAQLAELGYQ